MPRSEQRSSQLHVDHSLEHHPIIHSPLLSRCHRKSLLAIEIRGGSESDGGCGGRSECEVEGGAGGFGTGGGGRRTLGGSLVKNRYRSFPEP
ncbi:uncharacterized protein BO96DRAFT_251813 [Aspergillus niger CBS 101883]|uniref:uncharacterized protein n=1 Tax=Aspergillus lacticoffeatus (strain CBS 101883) TaxID=1450533 RepID=UPI000D8038E9|nr:uncharacterized protein BO96DRAFT_251813 [Aspergillus niger CBS 101883]PYH57978.1 hypothetical protein BO96DRAFT_251813 [Aspergillus niger CBS 101883]